MPEEFIKEAVGVFHDEPSLRAAADELMSAGFDRSMLSILSGHQAIEQTLGHDYKRVTDLEDASGVPRLAYISTDSRAEAEGALTGGLAYVGAVAAAGSIVASGGTMAAIIAATAVAGGAGGLVGAALSRVIERHHATYLEDQLNRGGILLWVRVFDDAHEEHALEILKRHTTDDVHVHRLPAPESRTADKDGVSHDLSFMNRLGM